MANLHILTTRAHNHEDNIWVVNNIIGLVRMGLVDKQELSAFVF